MAAPVPREGLKKELTLFDVYAISTGAMFSSGFFLLPGLAAAQAGPAVVLAYLLASFFILPAMFSVAELSTAMPRAGGAYYFLDRALGPIVGTVGGLGTWLALVLKSAFALIGMGAYLALFVDVPIKPVAAGLTLLFMLVNIIGAKESSGLQRWLVTVLIVVLAFFIVQGLFEIFRIGIGTITETQFQPFLPFGVEGLVGTIGFVFVSYAGLTKVASVSEEVRNPERNIPLGMMLSLATATFVYAVGVYIMVAVLNPAELRSDLTPVATAAGAFFDWLPQPFGVILIVVAATAAFASTGNAGILAASRYPLAMARDRLVWQGFDEVGRFGTPLKAIVATAFAMLLCIFLLDIAGIAKLASAFQLLLFSLLCLAVIVMRESGIESYDPGYRSPLYPWMQIVGILAPLWLIAEMGHMAILFTLLLVGLCVGWYFFYARGRIERGGAILHTFARFGEGRSEGLDRELRGIMKEKGLRREDPFDAVVLRADLLDLRGSAEFEQVVARAADLLAPKLGVPTTTLHDGFMQGTQVGATPVSHGAALPHLRLPDIERPEMVIVRCPGGVRIDEPEAFFPEHRVFESVRAMFFLVSPQDDPGRHLRLLAQIATRLDDPSFAEEWSRARGEQALKEALLHDDRFLSVRLDGSGAAAALVGSPLREVDMPEGSLVAVVRRDGRDLIPRGSTVLREGDRLTIIGEPDGIAELKRKFG